MTLSLGASPRCGCGPKKRKKEKDKRQKIIIIIITLQVEVPSRQLNNRNQEFRREGRARNTPESHQPIGGVKVLRLGRFTSGVNYLTDIFT